jgi:GrpB-like predicted nucleotidyltransferase (UPF0157 family)
VSNYELDREVWDISEQDFPADASVSEKARFLLRYAILAPSSHNSQPWSFRIEDNRVELRADDSRWLRIADSDQRELFISVGCALENLIVAAQHFGMTPTVDFASSDAGPVAVVDLGTGASTEEKRSAELFGAITERRTSHAHFYERSPNAVFFDDLEKLAHEPNTNLHIVTRDSARETLAEMQAAADETLMQDDEYRRELGDWIGSGALGDSWPKARIGQLVVTYFDIGKSEGANNAQHITSAPAVALITTADDSARSRIQAGQLYERVSLAATAENVAVHPLSQMLEVDDHRNALRDVFDTPDEVPQHFFRLGFARAKRKHTPRWPVEQFLS